jgi:hypothetical protein
MGLESALELLFYLRFQASLDPKTASTNASMRPLFEAMAGSKGKSSSRSEVTDSCQNSPPPGVRNASCFRQAQTRVHGFTTAASCAQHPGLDAACDRWVGQHIHAADAFNLFIFESGGLPSLRIREVLRIPYSQPASKIVSDRRLGILSISEDPISSHRARPP